MGSIKDAEFVEGQDDACDKVIDWLTKIAEGADTEGELELELVQIGAGTAEELSSYVYDFEDKIDEFVPQIITRAEADAEGLKGRCRYAVRVKGKKARVTFTLISNHISEDDGLEDFDEGPNKKGIMQQQMRHTEAAMKLMLQASRERVNDLKEVVRDQKIELSRVQKRELDLIKMTEELRNMDVARKMEISKHQADEARKEQVMQMLGKAVPLLQAKIMGGGAQMATEMSGESSPLEQMLDSLFLSLEKKPEKLQAIQGVLDPMDLQILFELHQFIAQRRKQTAEAQAKAETQPSAQNGSAPNPPTGAGAGGFSSFFTSPTQQ